MKARISAAVISPYRHRGDNARGARGWPASSPARMWANTAPNRKKDTLEHEGERRVPDQDLQQLARSRAPLRDRKQSARYALALRDLGAGETRRWIELHPERR